jgi:2-iminobutanoate/2-iminopropanoate deaminase
MPRQIVHTTDAPTSPYFSQAVVAGGHLRISGTVGVDPATGQLAGAEIETQTGQALTNCFAILAAAGAGADDILEVGVLLADPTDFAGFNAEWSRWFPEEPPARYVARLGVELPGVLVSLRMTAFVSAPS